MDKDTKLEEWYKIASKLAEIKKEEAELRKQIFNQYFPQPNEGTNTYLLPDGYALKGIFNVTRNIDEEELAILAKDETMDELIKLLVKYSPALDKKAYNMLDEDQKKIFKRCIIAKPGSISLKIVKPKKS